MDNNGSTTSHGATRAHATEPVKLAEHFARSEKFSDLFTYGMDLVEETATFLDTQGREEAKRLSRSVAGLYGTESMRLTTRLMQLASWLLLQRAVAEGDMSVEQAVAEKKNVKLNQLPPRADAPGWDELPDAFLLLVSQSVALQKRVQRLDAEIYGSGEVRQEPSQNAVASQHRLLETAFDRRF
ncbi:MAG: DUF1465 family protein [Pseudomonadota bacterium]